MSEKKPIFWGVEDVERLEDSEHDAVEVYLDNMLLNVEPGAVLDTLPETVVLVGYARMEVVPAGSLAELVLEHVLESLDEDYAWEDPSDATPGMKEAAEAFVAAVVKEYVPWNCEPVSRTTITVSDWVRENRPDWLESAA